MDKIENLSLDRDIECRGRFVGDQQVGPAGQGHGNRDALALAARKLVRIGIHTRRRVDDADPLQQANGVGSRLRPPHAAVQAQGLGDLVANRVDRVERCHRLLKDHANTVAAQFAQRCIVLANKFLPVEADAAAGKRVFRQQAHQRHRGDRFPAARLAHQAQGFATLQRKTDVPDGIGRPTLGL